MSNGSNITIIGAGIGGLSAALALSHANPKHRITVYESNSGLSEFGAGVLVSANSIRIFDAWRLYESIKKIAVEPRSLEFRRWDNNVTLFASPHNPRSEWLYDYPRWTLYRPDLQRELYKGLDRCKNVSVLFGKKIVHVDHATATVTMEDGS
ncbi:FAD/NAD(P)-binding domain-containing protein, partial [Fusarium austroafricanum]